MSFMPCMFLVNELQRLDTEEFLSYLLCKQPTPSALFFLQPRSNSVHASFSTVHYDTYELPSVLPAVHLIRPVGEKAGK